MSKAKAHTKRVWVARCRHLKKKDASEPCPETVDDRSAEDSSWTIVMLTMVPIVACLCILVFRIIYWVNTIVDVYNSNFNIISDDFDSIAQLLPYVNVSMSQKSLLKEFGDTERNELNVLY